MTKTELKKALKAAVPMVRFQESDAFGTRTPSYIIRAYIPCYAPGISRDDPVNQELQRAAASALEAFEAKVQELGYKSIFPYCSQVYAYWRSIHLK